jgi:tight adherence protein B
LSALTLERLLAATIAAFAGALAVAAFAGATVPVASRPGQVRSAAREMARLARLLLDEGRIDASFGDRRALIASIAVAGVAGFSLLGKFGIVIGAIAAPLLLRFVVRQRRARHRARIDACAAGMALALASSLAAGRSVRGALLVAGRSTPQPLSAELDRLAVDLTLGGGLGESLESLCARTDSARVASLAAAIELHRGSGGDLVRLMRELADAFRDRDRALRDARTATAQARYTALVVAAIPVVMLIGLELSSPGLVTGALTFPPSAVMIAASAALAIGGVVVSHRVGAN